MNDKLIVVPVDGMHCKSCELLVEDTLREIKAFRSPPAFFSDTAWS